MVKCSFCGKTVTPGTGIVFVKKNGTILNFCSSKCMKNYLKLKRKPAKIKWTAKHRELRVKSNTSKSDKKVKVKTAKSKKSKNTHKKK